MKAASLLSLATVAAAMLVGTTSIVSPVSSGELAPEVAAKLPDSRSQRVLIHLADTPYTKNDRGLQPEDRLVAVGRVIRGAVTSFDELISAGDLRIARSFRLQPTLEAEVTSVGVAALARNPMVRLIEPDRRWELQTLEGIELIGADGMHENGIAGDGMAVAIIDSGVDYLHPTLGGGQIPNAKVVYGLDTADHDPDPMDCDGHGTAVASVAAGVSYQWGPNRRFAGGVAPAAKVLAYKVTSDGECGTATTGAVVAAIEDAVLRRDGDDYRLAAINISLGGGRFSGPCDDDNVAYAEAVRTASDAGILVVASAGNNGYPDALNVPACLSRAVAVASAWDVDPGWIPYRFCLDPACARSCDDSDRWQRAVTCYSNSNRYLDLIAPSEFLKVAAAGNVTADFGGTSGAAAYVTGAAALVAQALDRTDPKLITFLLAASGTPTMDDKNGLVRPLIDLPAAVEAAASVAVSEGPVMPILRAPDAPTRSTVVVDRDGVVGHLEVFVDIVHPEPEHLRVSLQAPDGTEIALHDRAPGNGGLAGSYPNDLSPAESLGRFSGSHIRGSWTLTVEDLREADAGDGSSVLVGWALSIDEPAPMPREDTTLVFPVVAHTPGAAGTQWRSDVRLFNPNPSRETEVRLFLLPPSGSDAFDPRQTEVVVPHGSVVSMDDLVERRFGIDEAQGSLLVEDGTATVIHGASRTFTTTQDGSYGQFVAPEIGLADSVGSGDPSVIVLPTEGSDQRVNLGVTEVSGEPVTIAITLIDSRTGGALGASTFLQVDPFANIQLNEILPNQGAGGDPYIAVTVVQGQGRVTAYASVIDNRSGDAVFIRGAVPGVVPYLVVPVVARTQGHAGTLWRSDLRVLNRGNFSLHVDAELRFQGSYGIPHVTGTFALQPGQAVAIEDVVGTLFGFDSAVGSLRLVPREGPAALHATSRTANHGGAGGTYGQFVPAVAATTGLADVGVVLHVDGDAESRTNLGLVETQGHGVGIEIRLVDELGKQLGISTTISLGAWESVQLNDIFAVLGAPERRNARVELTRRSGNGAFFAYASVIDARSGDAIFVPVQALAAP